MNTTHPEIIMDGLRAAGPEHEAEQFEQVHQFRR